MSTSIAIQQLLSLLEEADTETSPFKPSETLAISVSQLGSPSQTILSGSLRSLSEQPSEKFGGPLHSFVIVGKRFHPMERDFAARFAIDKEEWVSISDRVYECPG